MFDMFVYTPKDKKIVLPLIKYLQIWTFLRKHAIIIFVQPPEIWGFMNLPYIFPEK